MEFSVTLELGDRNKYYDGLLATFDVDFASCADLERAEVAFHVTNIGDFQVEVGLGEPLLELRGRSVRRIGRTHDLSFYRHCSTTVCQRNRDVSSQIKTAKTTTTVNRRQEYSLGHPEDACYYYHRERHGDSQVTNGLSAVDPRKGNCPNFFRGPKQSILRY